MSRDKDALEQLRTASKPGGLHQVTHYLYFETAKVAREVASQLQASGYSTEDRLGADGENWLVLAKQKCVPTDAYVEQTRLFFEEIAERRGGEYDGWEAEVL